MEPLANQAQPTSTQANQGTAQTGEASEAQEFQRIMEGLASGMMSTYMNEFFQWASEEN